MPAVRERKTELDQYSPFPSSNAAEKIQAAKEEGRQIVQEQDAADALLGIKKLQLTPEQIAEFESAAYPAIDEELAKFQTQSTGGKRKKMRGGEVSEVIAKSSELWKAVLKTVGTPDNAAIAIAATSVGIASPALVHTAFSVARTALGVAARAITPETVAFTSCAALVYYYFGDKLKPTEEPISRQMAVTRMNNAIKEANTARRGSATLRDAINNFKQELDLEKSMSAPNSEDIDPEALEVQNNLNKYTAPSKIGVDQLRRIDVGKSLTNIPTPSQGQPGNTVFSPTSVSTSGKPPPPPKSKFFGGSRRRTKRHRRPSAPTRKRRSSSARRRGDTR